MTTAKAEKSAPDIGGFQVEVVTEVPETVRASRGIYAEIVESVPDAPQALAIDFTEPKKAATRVTGLRGYLKRHNQMEGFTVVRQGSKVFIGKVA